MKKIVYADHSATTYTDQEVLDAMLPYFNQKFGNASAVYSIGKESKQAIEKARQQVANYINAETCEIYFTAGGSEADNMIIKGIAKANKNRGNHIITSNIEHPAVLETCKCLEEEGFKVTYLSVDDKGFISLEELENNITKDTILISIMFANNEIGTIQNIKRIGQIAKKYNVYFHTDAVQAIGSERIDVKEMNLDALSLSAHKFYGPKGIGAAYIRKNIEFERLIDGGHQEHDKRAGTENISGIVGLGKAIEIANNEIENYNCKMLQLRETCIERILDEIPGSRINGDRNQRLCNNINVSFEGIEGENLVMYLDEVGICVSAGSACSSICAMPSHVLLAIGLPHKLAHSTLRITLGKENNISDIDYIIDNLKRIIVEIRRKNK